jgi:hypothetical protein
VLALRPKKKPAPRTPHRADELFAGARELFARDVELLHDGARVEPGGLALAEFHALRAIATHLGWLEEEPIDIECRNCGASIVVRPCAAMPLGPFADAELHDDELDELLDLDAPHEVPELRARVRLAPVTADAARPLHRALAAPELDLTGAVVRAMGVAAVGDVEDPRAIAQILGDCDEPAFEAVTNLFLEAHYSPRLFGLAICAECGTRNDVDAPYDREFAPREEEPAATGEDFPDFDAFDALARRIARPLLARAPGPPIQLVVEGGVPECDDGGEPLLGCYVPGPEPFERPDPQSPTKQAEITLFYRSFAATWKEDGPYDVDAELRETVLHELEHHEAHLAGHDPMDEEEQGEIAREARRVIGKKALVRASAKSFAGDLGEFWKRTWLIWIIALIVVVIAAIAAR